MQTVTTFDVRQMLCELGEDNARLAALATSVASEVPHHIKTMRETLAAGRLDSLEFSARYMGMLFDSLLAKNAANAANSLENAARRRDDDESDFAFESLEDEVDALLDVLAEFRSQGS